MHFMKYDPKGQEITKDIAFFKQKMYKQRMRVKVFICHADENQIYAIRVAECFEKCLGFDVFYSKESLRFSEDWLNDIWINLDKSDLFIPLLSKELNVSAFANQEIGVALVKNKRIMPLSLDGSGPKGFMKNQVEKYDEIDEDSILQFATLIYFNIFNERKLKPWVIPAMSSLVHAFCNSDSFKRTSIVLNLIIKTHKLKRFSREQIDKIVKASSENSMIHETDLLFPKLKHFLQSSYGITIDK